jgi:biotin operon repressor
MIDTGEVKNQSDLARKLGVSRARVCQVLSLLKLDAESIEAIENLGVQYQQGLSLRGCYEDA